MTLKSITLVSGINREGTNYSNSGGYFDGDNIRFRSGYPEKIGGWVRLSSDEFRGIARSLWAWVDLSGTNFLGIGTNLKYYIEKSGVYNDVTPIRKTSSPLPNNPFSTAFSTLNGGIDAVQTTLTLTSGTSFPSFGVVLIGTEWILYEAKSGNTLTNLTRGYQNTVAVSHLTGVNVGCSTITITDTANGATANDFVTFNGATAVGGFGTADINSELQILSIIDNDHYTANKDGVFSTSAATGGGAAVSASYQINTGQETGIFGDGWGTGTWGRSTWGSGFTLTLSQQLRLWSNDNYGQDLIIAPRGGAIYYWKASTGITVRAVTLASLATAAGFDGTYVPSQTFQVMGSGIERFVIAFGSNNYVPGTPASTFDPLLVRWSDQNNAYQWIPSITNQCGEYHLSRGSYIVSALTSQIEILIWTDSTLYSMQYVGVPYIWNFHLIQDNISIMGPNARVAASNIIYWMGVDKFYIYSGRVETLACSVKQYVFDDINMSQNYQVFAGTNEGFNEVWWFYCSKNANVNDKAVIYNYVDKVWYTVNMTRTAWLDSGIRQSPMAASYFNSCILYHEVGVDDVSGFSPVPINAYIQSSDFDIEDGHNFSFIWRMLPDVNFNGSTVNNPFVTVTLKPRQNAGASYGIANTPDVISAQDYTNQSVFIVQEFTGEVFTRLRGRQISFRIESNALGTAWQSGVFRADIRSDGRR